MISFMRPGGTFIVFARRYCVRPSSSMASARWTPGWTRCIRVLPKRLHSLRSTPEGSARQPSAGPSGRGRRAAASASSTKRRRRSLFRNSTRRFITWTVDVSSAGRLTSFTVSTPSFIKSSRSTPAPFQAEEFQLYAVSIAYPIKWNRNRTLPPCPQRALPHHRRRPVTPLATSAPPSSSCRELRTLRR